MSLGLIGVIVSGVMLAFVLADMIMETIKDIRYEKRINKDRARRIRAEQGRGRQDTLNKLDKEE